MSKERWTIDAGVSGTGVATWSDSKWDELAPPDYTVNIYPQRVRRGGDWVDRAESVLFQLRLLMATRGKPKRVYIEMPKYFADSVVGDTAIRARGKNEPGDVFKLMFLVGAIWDMAVADGVPVTLYRVDVWKGQMPKDVVERRIAQLLPDFSTSAHAWDATGIGLYAKGYFNQPGTTRIKTDRSGVGRVCAVSSGRESILPRPLRAPKKKKR